MPTTDPFPLSVTDKVNSPQLLAWLAQFGDDKFVRAEDFNQIFQALQFLYENMGGGGTFNPADYDLDDFQNLASDPFVRLSQVLTSADLQAVQEGIAWKQPVELNLDSGVTLSGSIPTITSLTQQGVTLVNDSRVIISGLSNQAFNGIFRVNSTLVSGTYRLYRTSDANTTAELNNAVVGVTSGTHAGKTFRQSTLNPAIGTTAITFVEFGNNTVSNATNLLAGIAKLYNTIGTQVDGGITPNAVKVGLDAKQDTLTEINFGTFINALNAKTTLVDADSVNIVDSADSNKSKKVTLLSVWNYIKGKSDSIYVTQNSWIDYSTISTIGGFGSLSANIIRYIEIGNFIYYYFNISGVSNGPTFTITTHVPHAGGSYFAVGTYNVNNGIISNNPPRIAVIGGSSTITILRDYSGTTWNTSGNKQVSGMFVIQKT